MEVIYTLNLSQTLYGFLVIQRLRKQMWLILLQVLDLQFPETCLQRHEQGLK